MKNKIFAFFTVLLLLFNFSPLFGADKSSEKKDDFNPPQWVKDIRRTEIITFGSLPFVTLWTTLGYSLAVKGEFHNPLNKSNSSFDETDQWRIIKISAATCVGLGLFDLSFNLVNRAIKNRAKAKKISTNVEVYPFSVSQQEEIDLSSEEEAPEFCYEGVESVIF